MRSFSIHSLSIPFAVLLAGGMILLGCDSQSGMTESTETSVEQGQASVSQGQSGSGQPSVQSSHAERFFRVEQGDECFCVTALSWKDQTVVEFYDYRPPHSHTSTDIERSGISNLFLFEGPQGTSLVALHDEPDDQHGTDEGGGAVTFDLTGLPTGSGQWVVEDDPPEIDQANDTDLNWRWLEQHTDGGAWRGGLDGSFSITIDPTFKQGINNWHVLSGDASDPERTSLLLDEPVTISTACIEVNIDIKPGSDPNALNPNSRGNVPVAVLHTADFDPSTIDVNTVRFGDPEDVEAGDGASPVHNGHLEDVDQDGDDDLVLHFPTEDTGFEGDEDRGQLLGETDDGARLFGFDSVKLVGGP